MSLPVKIPIVNSCIYIVCHEALRLIREKRAHEVYQDGKFIGIRLQARPDGEVSGFTPLPPAELPGLHFDDPNVERKYARFKWEWA